MDTLGGRGLFCSRCESGTVPCCETDTGFGDMGVEGEEAESLAEDGQGLVQKRMEDAELLVLVLSDGDEEMESMFRMELGLMGQIGGVSIRAAEYGNKRVGVRRVFDPEEAWLRCGLSLSLTV